MADSTYIGGLHAVKALLKANAKNTQHLLVMQGRNDSRLQAIVDLAKHAGVSIKSVTRHELDELAGELEHQGVLAAYNGAPSGNEQTLLAYIANQSEPLLILILDGLQDPHNLGACLRSADAAGVDAVVIPSDNSVGITPVVRKVASGAVETVPLFQVKNLKRTLAQLKEAHVWVYGADGDTDTPIYDLDLTGNVALVMGSEGSGLRRLTRENCDGLYKIPMHGSVGSLNVSVATGISLFEVRRQRQ